MPSEKPTDTVGELSPGGADAAQPQHPRESTKEPNTARSDGVTVDDNSQDWKGMDGATAFLLIQRHADGWSDVQKMMEEWLAANQIAALQESAPAQDTASGQAIAGCNYCNHPLFSGTKCKNCGAVFKSLT